MNIRHEEVPEDLASQIPPLVFKGIKRYVEAGIPTGDFLEAVLSNNLREAVGRADEHSLRALLPILQLLYSYVPGDCWGSPDKVEAWLDPTGKAAMMRDLQAVNI